MNNEICLHDKCFQLYIPESSIQKKIKELAQDINEDYKDKQPIILCILNGSFIFTADLIRHFNFPLTVEFVRYSSYQGTKSSGSITKMLGMKSEIKDQDIIIVEDIIDTGFTLSNAIIELQKSQPSSVKVASLLLKPDALKHKVPCDYIGFEIPNEFVVGFGLDYDELGRDLPEIYKLKD